MRMLVKFMCVAVFLIGCMSKAHTMIIMFDKDGKPIMPNYALLARDLVVKMSKANAQLESDRIDSDASDAPVVSDIGSRLRSAILSQTQESTSTTQGRSIIYLAPLGALYHPYSRIKELAQASTPNDGHLTPTQQQMLHEEYQALLAHIDAASNRPTWNGRSLFAGTQIHDISHIDANTAAVAGIEHSEVTVNTSDLMPYLQLTQPSEKMISAEHEGDLVDEEAIANPNSSHLTFTDYEIEETPAAENEQTSAISPLSRKLVIYYGNSSERRIDKVKLPL